jgi:hypothetical protein
MSDDSTISRAAQTLKVALWKRVRAWTVVVVLYALLLGMVWLAVTLLSSAIRPGVALDDRMFKLLGAGVFLVLPVKVAWAFIKRKRSTGGWFVMTEQEKARNAALRSAGQCGTTTQGTACGGHYQSWITFASCWAGYFAWKQNAGLWKRTLAWTLIVLHAACVLSLMGFGIVCIGASSADGVRQPLVLILVGLAFFGISALAMWPSISRFHATGSLRVSEEEFQSAAAQRATVENKQRQRPLRNKIISYAIAAVVMGLWWARTTVYHSRHPHEFWTTPAFFTIFLVYSAWRDFSKPAKSPLKSSRSSFAPEP